MKKIKETKKKVTQKTVEEESINLKSVIKVFIIILVVFVIFYGLTILVLNRQKDKKKNAKHEYNNINIKDNDILATDLLKQKDDLYYVVAIKDNKEIYDLYLNNINTPIYNINLDNALNKSILGNETIVTEDLKDLRISDTALFIVENHVITEYYVGQNDVVNKLSTLAF